MESVYWSEMSWLNMDMYDRETCGKTLWECSRAKSYIMGASLLYVLLCACLLAYLFSMAGMMTYFLGGLIFVLILWRIHWIHKSVILICEKKALVTVPVYCAEFEWIGLIKPLYMVLDYSEIVGISDDWSCLFLGERVDGGIVELPVQLKYVSPQDKARIQEWIEHKQRQES